MVCLFVPPQFVAVGAWYEHFEQPRIARSGRCSVRRTVVRRRADHRWTHGSVRKEVTVRAGEVDLAGELVVPEPAKGVVLFAHGSGSSRHSPRNQAMARTLRAHGFGTLLFDLLTEPEAADRRRVFESTSSASGCSARRCGCVRRRVGTPASRLLRCEHRRGGRALGCRHARQRGGRGGVAWRASRPRRGAPRRGAMPDAARRGRRRHRSPCAQPPGRVRLRCINQLTIVPGATHLFEEPGAMEMVAGLAIDWFERYLPP